MAILEIKTFPDPVLRQECREVEIFDEELNTLARDMAETMYQAPGVGLAAPQVGVPIRLLVCDPSLKDEPDQLISLVNPEIVEEEGEACIEGRLPFRARMSRSPVDRAARVKVKAQDLEGRPVTIDADEFLAIILQHEIDHLDGNLIVDHMSSLKRSLYRRKQKKAKAEEEAE